ncbi:HK97 family phage prohead protease, partial [[Clostridium] innocuum]
MDEFVRRSYMCEVRSEDGNSENERTIVGRPIVYESKTDMGWYDEVICRGALDETDLTDVSFLINHMTGMIPMARSRKDNINSTMQLTVDVNGMA